MARYLVLRVLNMILVMLGVSIIVFGLSRMSGDPRYLYMTTQHREAMNHMLYGIRERKGFICLTGEIGAGKTTLCRALLAALGPGYRTALVLNPMLTETQLLRALVDEFAIPTKSRDRLGYINLLNDFLLKVNSSGARKRCIVSRLGSACAPYSVTKGAPGRSAKSHQWP